MSKIIQGNIIAVADSGIGDVLVHQTDCFCSMNGTLSSQIKNHWPQAYAEDCKTIAGDVEKLGKFTSARVKTLDGSTITIINAYTQFDLSNDDKCVTNYNSIEECFIRIRQNIGTRKLLIPYNYGCGLAHGDWPIVKAIIDRVLQGYDYTYVQLDSPSLPNVIPKSKIKPAFIPRMH